MLMMHINMWLACFDADNAAQYHAETVRLAQIDNWLQSDYFQLLPIEQSTEIFKGFSLEGIFEIAQNITTGEIFNTANQWTTTVVFECLSKSSPTYIYSRAMLQKLYPCDETDRRKEFWFKGLKYDLQGDITIADGNIEIVKTLNQDRNGTTVIPNAGNYILFRLADAILLYAEALYKTAQPDKALAQVNRIRERAQATLFDESVNIDEAIYWERVRELMGEGQYFYDLVRTEKLCDANYATFSDGSGYRERRANFLQGAWTWPVFKGALEDNPYISKNMYWE